MTPEKNIAQSSTKKHTSHDTNNFKRLENKKYVVILNEGIAILLNGWKMANKKQFYFKNLRKIIFLSKLFMYGR